MRGNLADSSQRTVDLAVMFVNLGGLLFFIAVILASYLAAVAAAESSVGSAARSFPTSCFHWSRSPRRTWSPTTSRWRSSRGSSSSPLISDPFGRGWDLFGTVGFAPNLAIVTYETVWYVQVGALVIGHVAGLAIAHDRAVVVFHDRRTSLEAQLPMLGLMVLYTLMGMWLLTRG